MGIDGVFDAPNASAQYDAIMRALSDPPVRIRSLTARDGQILWLKRAERMTPWLRLTKGAANRNFEKDRAALRVLGRAGMPVAPIVAEGPDFVVTPDLGVTLRTLMDDPGLDDAKRREVFAAAGAALARLHASGFSHGRPAVRDICWDGQDVHFIDFERFSLRRSALRHRALDVVIFVHSIFSIRTAAPRSLAEAAMAAYVAGAPAEFASSLRRLLWGLAPLGAACRAVLLVRPGSREVAAVPLMLDFLTELTERLRPADLPAAGAAPR